MREIFFRGKRTDNGEWVEGYYIHLHNTTYCLTTDYNADPSNDIHQIVFEHMTDWGLPNKHLRADVDPSTVGQYTGIRDKNGKPIFNGDILKWDEKEWGGPYREEAKWDYSLLDMRKNDWPEWCEIIGNVFDNPELLK